MRAIDMIGLAGKNAALIDRIHMRDQHQLSRACPLECTDHDVGAGARRGLLPPRRSAQRLQASVREVGHFREALDIAAAALDHHHVAQRLDQRRLLLFGCGFQLLIGCSQRHIASAASPSRARAQRGVRDDFMKDPFAS
jgi:hypothetical protein